MATMADRIRERRKAMQLKQDDLAELLNITQSQISRYERGENDPTGDVLIALARILATTTDYLLGVSEDPAQPSNDLAPKEKKALAAWRRGDTTEAIRIIVGNGS